MSLDGPCGARTRNGGTCKRPPVPGATRCRLHGGASPNSLAKAKERLQEAAATKELARLGVTRLDIHPAEALIELVQFTAGEVAYWRNQVAQLDSGDLTATPDARADGPTVTFSKTKQIVGGNNAGEKTFEAVPHVAYRMLTETSNRLASYAAAALKAGVEERRVRLAEQQGQLVAQAIRQILDQLNLTPAQQELVPTVVPAALRLISGSVP